MQSVAEDPVPRWPAGDRGMARLIQTFDWAGTSLGPLAEWPQSLRTAVDLLLASPQPAYIAAGPDLLSFCNDAYLPLIEGMTTPIIGRPLREVWPDLAPFLEPSIQQVLSGKAIRFEDAPFRIKGRQVDREVWFSGSWIPIRDERGDVSGFLATFIETTDRVLAERGLGDSVDQLQRAQAALSENEERLRLATEAADILAWEIDAATGQVFYNETIARMFGFDPESTFDQNKLIEMVHPDDQYAVAHGMKTARQKGERYEGDYCARGAEGWIWVHTVVVPHRGPDGSILRWIGMSQDISQRKRAEQRQAILLAELQHRVRNILAMTRSIARRTGETSSSVQAYAQHLEGRISALARTQALLTRDPDSGVDLCNMLLEEFRSQAAPECQYQLSGPDIRLAPKAAEVLTLAIHELTTNSVKYGALGEREGALSVTWRQASKPEGKSLVLEWEESGLTLTETPPRRGFGTELITRRVPYELQGSGSLEFHGNSLHARIEFPLIEGESVLQTSFAEGRKEMVA